MNKNNDSDQLCRNFLPSSCRFFKHVHNVASAAVPSFLSCFRMGLSSGLLLKGATFRKYTDLGPTSRDLRTAFLKTNAESGLANTLACARGVGVVTASHSWKLK